MKRKRRKKEKIAFRFDSHLYKEIIVITLDIYGCFTNNNQSKLPAFFRSTFDIYRTIEIFGVYGQ
jgi:hypothetical protein